jgi:hypothetical protein
MDHYSHIRMVARRKALAIVSYVRFLSGFSAVSRPKPTMIELIAFLPRNLETNKTLAENCSLIALTALDDCPPFH